LFGAEDLGDSIKDSAHAVLDGGYGIRRWGRRNIVRQFPLIEMDFHSLSWTLFPTGGHFDIPVRNAGFRKAHQDFSRGSLGRLRVSVGRPSAGGSFHIPGLKSGFVDASGATQSQKSAISRKIFIQIVLQPSTSVFQLNFSNDSVVLDLLRWKCTRDTDTILYLSPDFMTGIVIIRRLA
jgi:hypothetical protein